LTLDIVGFRDILIKISGFPHLLSYVLKENFLCLPSLVGD